MFTVIIITLLGFVTFSTRGATINFFKGSMDHLLAMLDQSRDRDRDREQQLLAMNTIGKIVEAMDIT